MYFIPQPHFASVKTDLATINPKNTCNHIKLLKQVLFKNGTCIGVSGANGVYKCSFTDVFVANFLANVSIIQPLLLLQLHERGIKSFSQTNTTGMFTRFPNSVIFTSSFKTLRKGSDRLHLRKRLQI